MHSSPPQKQGPKNGYLFLALVASLGVMVLLAMLNLRLISDPSVAVKAFRSSDPAKPAFGGCPPLSSPGSAVKDQACYAPPEVTFYRKLTAQEEAPKPKEVPATNEQSQDSKTQPEVKQSEPQPKPVESVKRAKPESAPVVTREREPSEQRLRLPEQTGGKKEYVVQVGAFAHPTVAQEWAQTWRSRGYKVTLKPVARPRMGVIYRLCLGEFNSSEKADELVRHLKAQEGINAFRLAVRK